MLGLEGTFTAQDLQVPLHTYMYNSEKVHESFVVHVLQHVDPVVARSFAQLAAVAVKKHRLEGDPTLVSHILYTFISEMRTP